MLKSHGISAAIAFAVTLLIAQMLQLWQSPSFLLAVFAIVYGISFAIGAFLKWQKTRRQTTAQNASLHSAPPQPAKIGPVPPQD
jgi:uncharacterized membrane protein YidH (DUF202 family)